MAPRMEPHFPRQRKPHGLLALVLHTNEERPLSVAPNELKRYNFSYSSLKSEADGSLKIGIGPKPVAGVPENSATMWPRSLDSMTSC